MCKSRFWVSELDPCKLAHFCVVGWVVSCFGAGSLKIFFQFIVIKKCVEPNVCSKALGLFGCAPSAAYEAIDVRSQHGKGGHAGVIPVELSKILAQNHRSSLVKNAH
jgi:hypothetical protein